jgi:hypothetical protein
MTADGSVGAPFTDLKTALENPLLDTGDTIYLRAGTHHLTADIDMRASGVTVCPYPGETVVVDLQQSDLALQAPGLVLRDVTILSSDTQRTSAETGSDPTDILAGAINGYASLTLKNVRITGPRGVGWWTGSTGLWRGVLVQDVGWDATDRGHGHALYTQNNATDGNKTLDACILVNGYSNYSLHLYGSGNALLAGYTFTDCIFMNDRALIGGETGSVIDAVTSDNCAFYVSLSMGWATSQNQTASVTGCLIRALSIQHAWQDLTVSGCTVLAADGDCVTMPTTADFSGLHIDNNVYISSKAAPFVLEGEGSFTLAAWRTRTGLDATSRHYTTIAAAVSAGDLTVPVVRVFAVAEGNHKANIAIWNPNSDATVSVDLSALALANGSYELRQVRDYTGDVRAVTYTGAAVTVSMSGTTEWPPGYPTPYHPDTVPANALPVFGAFELWAV